MAVERGSLSEMANVGSVKGLQVRRLLLCLTYMPSIIYFEQIPPLMFSKSCIHVQIIKKNGEFENVYNAFPGLKVCSKGEIKYVLKNQI